MILAFDIGGSRIKAAVWDGALRPLGEVATPLGDKAAFTAAIAGFVQGGERGIAISIAGVVDPATGIGTVANIPAIDGLALGPELRAATGLPGADGGNSAARTVPWPRPVGGPGGGVARCSG